MEMNQPSRFDAIVVGAGPAGATAALKLAEKGYKVLLLERGRGAGSKQVFGGRVYAELLRRVFGDLKDAPIHRWVKREALMLADGDRLVAVAYWTANSTSFTTYLGQLTSWIVERAVNAGAVFVDEVRVDRLLVRDGRVVGIEAGPDRVEADVVIDAEGVNRLLLERLGLVAKPKPAHVALGVKEVIRLSEKAVTERFGLEDGEGLAWVIVGSVTDYLPGGAFVYTNKDSVSVGLVLHLDAAVRGLRAHVHELVERLRLHPLLRRYWGDGDVVEYSAHLTIESPEFIPKSLVHDGLIVVGDAAGLLLSTGLTVRGVDYAVFSGFLAAEAVDCARKEGGFTRDVLSACYEQPLRRSAVYRDIVRRKRASKLMKDERLFRDAVRFAVKAASTIYELGEETPKLAEALEEAERAARLSKLSLALMLIRLVRGL